MSYLFRQFAEPYNALNRSCHLLPVERTASGTLTPRLQSTRSKVLVLTVDSLASNYVGKNPLFEAILV